MIKRIAAIVFWAILLCSGTFLAGGGAAQPADEQRPQKNEITLQIDPLRNQLKVFINGKLHRKYEIALGKPETPTPVGEFVVINKYKNWGSGFGTRWIGLNVPWGIYGIHGTNKPHSIGSDASHGCIRMYNRDVEEIYEIVRLGTRISILGHVLGELDQNPRRLAKGDVGADVQYIQSRLRSAGYFNGPVNGKFGEITERAIKRFEQDQGLPVDGVMSQHDYIRLGLVE
ncbi:L,D-transpeptidase family protein [Ferviditalea candida]|uniref:L,D-transpeptidase family protein n=1 Tax=Ferviditalea candida TaxID=3108399 RepID=A0ABU5ZDX8_9BACL|nr:L,D-transpeptidase family protein [Paenibacillaceae bacterium T2]